MVSPLRPALAIAFVALLSRTASAQSPECPAGYVCLPEKDFQQFLAIAKERQCLDRTMPKFAIDQIVIITDEEGRVFYTGADPARPYQLQMTWCHYDIAVEGKIELIAALREPETWGFRFRPKAYLGYLPFKLSDGQFDDGIDAGFMLDWFFFQWVNANLAVGFRSVGVAVGADLTSNFGLTVGYGLGWTAPLHNLTAAAYFAF